MLNSNRVTLKGSEREPLAGAQAIGTTDPHQMIEVSVILKRIQSLPKMESRGRHLNHTEFAQQYGADPAHINLIRKFASENNLQILERGDEVERRTITLAGTAAAMEKAFSVELKEYEHPEGSYRGRTGSIQVPADIADASRVYSDSTTGPLQSPIIGTEPLREPSAQEQIPLPIHPLRSPRLTTFRREPMPLLDRRLELSNWVAAIVQQTSNRISVHSDWPSPKLRPSRLIMARIVPRPLKAPTARSCWTLK